MPIVWREGFPFTTSLERQKFPAVSGRRANSLYTQKSELIYNSFGFPLVNLLKDFRKEKKMLKISPRAKMKNLSILGIFKMPTGADLNLQDQKNRA
jgi:hypothetical protein